MTRSSGSNSVPNGTTRAGETSSRWLSMMRRAWSASAAFTATRSSLSAKGNAVRERSDVTRAAMPWVSSSPLTTSASICEGVRKMTIRSSMRSLRSVLPVPRRASRRAAVALEHDSPTDHRQNGSCVENLTRWNREEVAWQHDQIGQLPFGERTFSRFGKLCVRRAEGVVLDGLRHGDPLLGKPPARRGSVRELSRHRGIEPEHRIERFDEPVGPERNAGTRIDERLEVVGNAAAFAADARFRPAHVVDAVARLNRGDCAERFEALLVFLANHLDVLDARPPVTGTLRFGDALQNVQHDGIGAIANRVHDQLKAGGVGLGHRLLERFRRLDEQPARL